MTEPAPAAPAAQDGATTEGERWLAEARADVAQDPATVSRAFALAGRKVGRAPVRPDADPAGVVHGTVDDEARAAIVVALAEALGRGADGDASLAARLADLYQHGDTAERRGVLRGLDALTARGALAGDAAPSVVAVGRDLAADALRTNDQSLVAAAVGPFAAAHLDQHAWRHAVLKLVFMGVSLDAVAGLDDRADDELARMARDFAAERRAAGRVVPDDVARLAPDVTTGRTA
ncbi:MULTISPECIES: EboA domain-containing protein [Cellulosimicrobium]|uniref:EboA domain-containing protein n=1 Tax=Cellulosimicrobium sp. ES-005 TaxID=3163031 RepID=A0AAU8G304_9MICO|nr:EboA domain-containing protein [Cellulosimicrobium cellulans]MCO7274541.1 EboA domain-containing protein [Cellulosimicrobium cellulans]